jgi:hypothetical protein
MCYLRCGIDCAALLAVCHEWQEFWGMVVDIVLCVFGWCSVQFGLLVHDIIIFLVCKARRRGVILVIAATRVVSEAAWYG